MATFFKVIKQSLYLKERIRACDVYTLYFTFPYFYVLYHYFGICFSMCIFAIQLIQEKSLHIVFFLKCLLS